jgi:HAD superfamily hydrolase (TIGR01509 family)
LKEEGIPLSANDYYKNYLAYDDWSCFEKILRRSKSPTSPKKINELVRRKAAYYDAFIQQHLRLFPGVKKWIPRLAKHYLLAIASAALKHEILWVLKTANLLDQFKVIISAQDTHKSKPDPESYLLALKKLNRFKRIRPEECLVVEDSISGIRGAHRAGMKCLALAHTYSKNRLKEADLILEGFRKIKLDTVKKLFKN